MLILAVLVAGLLRQIDASIRYQRAVRSASIARSRLLRLQIDEETGLRGYLGTHLTVFLRPYRAAQTAYAQSETDFERDLALLDGRRKDLDADVAEERRLHEQWIAEIAGPLLAPRPTTNTVQLQLRGKTLVDGYRNANARLSARLNQISEDSDRRLERNAFLLVAFSGLFEFVLLGLALLMASAERRAERARAVAEDLRVQFEADRRLADTLQQAFSPNELPMLPNLGLHASYTPAEQQSQVGGDWYDAIFLDENRVFFSIGDVTGHGIDAAVTMSRVRQSLIASAVRESDPGAILQTANDTLLMQSERIVTAIAGFIDLRSFEIRYATAGHPPPILARNTGEAHALPIDGIPLGIMRSAKYRTFVANGCAGALFVLYTDGLIEHKRDIIAGEARLLYAVQIAARNASADPTATIRQHVFGNSRAADDVAILAIRFGELSADVTLNALQASQATIER